MFREDTEAAAVGEADKDATPAKSLHLALIFMYF
jgi:hypothetical protein